MRLAEILQPGCVKVPIQAQNKQGAIFELIDLVAQAHQIADAEKLKQAVWQRELTRTTGIGHGIAIPHGKIGSIDRLIMGVGKPAQPIEFQSIDRRPVELVILLVSPEDQTGPHIQALARISQILMPADIRHQILAARSAQELFDCFLASEPRKG